MASTSNQPPQTNRSLIIKAFHKFENYIKDGDIDKLKQIIHFLFRTCDKASLADIYEDENNSIREMHLITLACKYKKHDVLDFLLYKSDVLQYLPKHGPVVDKAYVQAFCETIRSNDTRMLETVYDYLSGDLHWLGTTTDLDRTNSNKVQILTKLQSLLFAAMDECKRHLQTNPQIFIDIDCLRNINEFQIKLYSELSVPRQKAHSDERMNEVEAIKSDLLIAFKLYEQFSGKIFSYLPRECGCEGLCYMCYFNFDVFYRKLDHNIALIIANNIHSLKLRLNLSDNVYQQIECAVYYFLYRVHDNWKLYLPEHIPKFGVLNHQQNESNAIASLPYYEVGTVVYKEWIQFKNHLKIFKEALEKCDIVNNLRKKGTKLPKEEINQLSLSPYEAIRDDYSLKKILQYLEQVSYIDLNRDQMRSTLIIQRLIQMTGEFLKGSDESSHLTATTFALLHIEIPKDAYNDLRDLRNDFSKAKDGKLDKRIDLELNENQVYIDVIKDLEVLKNTIHTFITDTYQPIIEKHLLTLGIELLNKRFASMPVEIDNYKDDILKIFDDSVDWEQFLARRTKFVRRHPPLTEKLFTEIMKFSQTSDKLKEKVAQRVGLVKLSLIKHIPKYTNTILDSVVAIEKQNKAWQLIKTDFIKIHDTVALLDYPNVEDIKIIKKGIHKKKTDPALKNTIKGNLEDIKIKDRAKHWLEIKTVIQFIIRQASTIEEQTFENELSSLYGTIQNTLDDVAIRKVRLIIQHTEEYCSRHLLLSTSSQPPAQDPHQYEALKILAEKVKTTPNNVTNWLSCLLNRLNHLDKVLEGEDDIEKLILRYLQDVNFRNVSEMLVSDIMNIYKNRRLYKLMKSHTNLLSEVSLRNILCHGNSFYDLCSLTLDHKDYPKALFHFVLEAMRYPSQLKDLFILSKDGVDCVDIRDESNNLNHIQKTMVQNFKTCPEWEEYIKLYH